MHGAERLSFSGTPVVVLASAGVILVLRPGAPVLGPILLSVLLAYALEPAVAALVRRHVPRIAAAVCVDVVLGLPCRALAATSSPES